MFADDQDNTTFMQDHDIQGLRKNKAVLQPGKSAQTYNISADDHLSLTEHNRELEIDVLAFIVSLDVL